MPQQSASGMPFSANGRSGYKVSEDVQVLGDSATHLGNVTHGKWHMRQDDFSNIVLRSAIVRRQ